MGFSHFIRWCISYCLPLISSKKSIASPSPTSSSPALTSTVPSFRYVCHFHYAFPTPNNIYNFHLAYTIPVFLWYSSPISEPTQDQFFWWHKINFLSRNIMFRLSLMLLGILITFVSLCFIKWYLSHFLFCLVKFFPSNPTNWMKLIFAEIHYCSHIVNVRIPGVFFYFCFAIFDLVFSVLEFWVEENGRWKRKKREGTVGLAGKEGGLRRERE